MVLTNGSAYPPAEQAAKLRHAGLPVEDEQMVTPSSVAADLMHRRGVRRALILGTAASARRCAMPASRPPIRAMPHASEVDAVYVGWHPDCGMPDIESACQAIWAGAKLYVASDVPFFATKQGRTIGYSFAIVGAIRRMTKAPMILTGKPSLHALRFVARKLGVPMRHLAVVGDDPLVEIVMARRGGALAVGVTTGVTDLTEWARQPPARRPHHVLGSLHDLLGIVSAPRPAPP